METGLGEGVVSRQWLPGAGGTRRKPRHSEGHSLLIGQTGAMEASHWSDADMEVSHGSDMPCHNHKYQ